MLIFKDDWDGDSRKSLQTTIQGELLHYTGHNEGQNCLSCRLCKSNRIFFDPKYSSPYNSLCHICDSINSHYTSIGDGLLLFSHRLSDQEFLIELLEKLGSDDRISRLVIFQLDLEKQERNDEVILIKDLNIEYQHFKEILKDKEIFSEKIIFDICLDS